MPGPGAEVNPPPHSLSLRPCRGHTFRYFKNTKKPVYSQSSLFTKHESLVTKGIRLVGFATRAMVCESPTHYLILNSLACARGRVILRSHFLILLLLIILISHYILTSTVILLLCDHRVRIFQQCFVDADR